jgi:pimeloyl-ACP methyl ester carboxylesterase
VDRLITPPAQTTEIIDAARRKLLDEDWDLGVVGPAWKSLPSWFLVAEGDQAIPADAERLFAKRMNATTTEVPTNHVAMVSHPDDVVTLIKSAARALT